MLDYADLFAQVPPTAQRFHTIAHDADGFFCRECAGRAPPNATDADRIGWMASPCPGPTPQSR